MNAWELDAAIKPSRYQQGLNWLFYSMAMAAIWCAYIPIAVQFALSGVLLVWVIWQSLKWAKVPPMISRLSTEEQEWFVQLATGQRLKVTLSRCFLWRYLAILTCQSAHIRVPYVLVIFADSIDADNYRRLQAKLRLS